MCYMAPEVLMRQVPSFSADVYAFGVTVGRRRLSR